MKNKTKNSARKGITAMLFAVVMIASIATLTVSPASASGDPITVDPSSSIKSEAWIYVTWGHWNWDQKSIVVPGSDTAYATHSHGAPHPPHPEDIKSTTTYTATPQGKCQLEFDMTMDNWLRYGGISQSKAELVFSVVSNTDYDISGSYTTNANQEGDFDVSLKDLGTGTFLFNHADTLGTLSGSGLTGTLPPGDYEFRVFTRSAAEGPYTYPGYPSKYGRLTGGAEQGTGSVHLGLTVQDTTPPVISLVGDNPQTIEFCDAYTELGATATDDCCGDLTGDIVIDASAVDTSTVGSYTVTYDVTDCNGNPADTVTRTVNVGVNLLTNPSAETGDLSGWTIIADGGHGWKAQEKGYAHEGDYVFVTSYEWCKRSQEIDLLDKGYTGAQLDASPTVNVGEWFRERDDVGDEPGDPYRLIVELQDENHTTIVSWDTGVQTVDGASWKQESHTFSGYSSGLRYIYFEDWGKDSEWWAHWYGVRLDDASVRIAIETTPPEITCPADVEIECGASTDPVDTGSATAADNCDPNPTITYSDSTSGTCPEVIARTWTATDDCGNSVSCTQTITVVDTTAPVITCPGDVTVEQESAAGTAVPLTATATDICDASPTITSDELAVYPLGTTTVTFTATDDSGNSASCTTTVTVQDTTAPVITCPDDVTVEQENAAGTWVPLTATATDICDADVSITSDAPVVFPLGTTTVTFTATDDSGNSASCTTTVTVQDTTAPVITCPDDVTVEQVSADGTAVPLTATATDICDADVSITSDAPARFPLGTTTVTFTATDDSGNTASCTTTVTVVDTTAPEITCPDDVTVEQETRDGTAVPLTATATDICDADVVITSDELAIYSLGTTTVTFTATDDSGNSASCTTTVTVIDTTAPDISVTVSPDMLWPPNHKMVDITATVTASDICDAAPSVVLTGVTSDEPDDAKGSGDGKTVNDIQGADTGAEDYEFQLRAERAGKGDGRVYTITYTVTDASGNSASASATVVVPHDME